jgi:hypothetical protein
MNDEITNPTEEELDYMREQWYEQEMEYIRNAE